MLSPPLVSVLILTLFVLFTTAGEADEGQRVCEIAAGEHAVRAQEVNIQYEYSVLCAVLGCNIRTWMIG